MKKYKLAIHCITYNHEKYIAQALDSFVTQQTNFPFIIIVGDDASTDHTPQIIQQYVDRYPDLIKPIFQQKNVGVRENWIQVASEIKSEYVISCEGDDYFTNVSKLQKQVDFLDAHSDYSICFHPVRIFWEDGSKEDSFSPSHQEIFNKIILDIDDLLVHNFMQTNSVMYRWRFNNENIRDVFPTDIMPGDWFLHLLHAQIGKIGFLNEVMSDYRKHKEGIWSGTSEKIHLKWGIQELKFYITVEEKITSNKALYHQVVINNAKIFLSNYLKNQQYDKAIQILKLCPDFINNQNILLQKLKDENILLQRLKKKYKIIIVTLFVLFIVLLIFYFSLWLNITRIS